MRWTGNIEFMEVYGTQKSVKNLLQNLEENDDLGNTYEGHIITYLKISDVRERD